MENATLSPTSIGPEEPAVEQPTAATEEPLDERPSTATIPGIWQLAWPAILSNLLFSAVSLVDIKVVGALGPAAIAAATTGNRLFFVTQAILIAITAGTTAMVARAWGANDRDEAARVTKASLVLSAGFAFLTMLPGILFAEQLASFFQLEEETLKLAAIFIRWLSFFNIAFAIMFVFGVSLRAAGDTITPLWIGAITNVVNVVLLYGLVHGNLGMPKLGVKGAALATGLAFTVGCLISLWMWIRGHFVVKFGPSGSITRKHLGQLLFIGYPAGLEQLVFQLGLLAFLWLVALFGTAPYAAYGIGVNILSLSFVVGAGFSIAASTHVGQHLGAKDLEGAERSGWRAFRFSTVAMSLLGIAVILTADNIAGFLIDDPETVQLTVDFIYILGAVQPLMAIEFALAGALRGAGDTRFPFIAVLTGLFGVRVVLAALFTWLDWSVQWVFAALIGDYLVKSSMLIWRFRTGKWKTIQV